MFRSLFMITIALFAVLFLSACQDKPVTDQSAQANAKAVPKSKGPWKRLENDGLHDPTDPAINVLQQPGDALSILPRDTVGNHVNWVKALDDHYINPRSNIYPDTKINVLDLDILLDLNGALPIVRFPHRQHTLWLDCTNCHDAIFKKKAGATRISMDAILRGKFCGRCHGAVSFPLTECNRCHTIPHYKLKKFLAHAKANDKNVVLAYPIKSGKK